MLLDPAAGAWCENRRAQVEARLDPPGVGAEGIGHDGEVDPAQVVPQLRVGVGGVDGQGEQGPLLQLPEPVEQGGVVARVRGVGDLPEQVDHEPGVGQRRHGVGHGAGHGAGCDVGAQALEVHPDREGLRGPRARVADQFEGGDVRVGDHDDLVLPPGADRVGGGRGEGDDAGGCRHEHVEPGEMRALLAEVGVDHVVEGEDERQAVPVEGLHPVAELVRGEGVEPEVEMDEVDLVVVGVHPRARQGRGRPPLPRRGPRHRRVHGIRVSTQRRGRPDALGVVVPAGHVQDPAPVWQGHRGVPVGWLGGWGGAEPTRVGAGETVVRAPPTPAARQRLPR